MTEDLRYGKLEHGESLRVLAESISQMDLFLHTGLNS